MKSEAIVVQDNRPGEDDARLKQLVEVLGLSCKALDISALDMELDRAADHELCVMASTSTLSRWCNDGVDPATALNHLFRKSSSVFIYSFANDNWSPRLAAIVTEGAISAVQTFTRPDLRYEVSSSDLEITKEFSGLCFDGVRKDVDFGFVSPAIYPSLVPLISIGGMPLWGFVQKGRCKVFLLACSVIADLGTTIEGNIDVREYFSRLLPAAMFLKWAFGTRCWHSKHRCANFIIDDPLLKRSYGHLDYGELVSRMDRSNFATTIAFIPWNYRRTETAVAQLFRRRPDRLSVCVHGCDHTAGEFATTDLQLLNSIVQIASARMQSFQQRTGVFHSQVLVFPQGRFSPEALTVLKSNNYLAAINSSASPENPACDGVMTVLDLLDAAITKLAGFPLFVRRYPAGLEQFAFDLFFGKPVLIVEHHHYLSDGGKRLAALIAQLNTLQGLRWTGLHDLMRKSHLERETSDRVTACRLFTNQHIIENHSQTERIFVVTKSEPGVVPVQEVLLNGRPAAFTKSGDVLRFSITIPARSSIIVTITYKNILPSFAPKWRFAHRTRVWTRRMLSEFRDNCLSRSDFVLEGAQTLNRKLLARADRVCAQSHDDRGS